MMNENKFHQALAKRKADNALRKLPILEAKIDFFSNDYLGLARSLEVKNALEEALKLEELHGATGSRLISGNHQFLEQFETFLAHFHQADSALLFNSGYVANQGLISCIADRHDTILYDQLVHASLREAVQYSRASSFSFRHNDISHLQERLERTQGNVFVVVESIYSMDGDEAPLKEMVDLCQSFGAAMIVDEAHATGVFGQEGRGLVAELGLEKAIWARIYTFGKALGSHGAVIVGANYLRDYLVNFSKPFIYTTALPSSHFAGVWKAYEMMHLQPLTEGLQERIRFFLEQLSMRLRPLFIPSRSAIQCLLLPGNATVKAAAQQLQDTGYAVLPILHPTAPLGQERLRICLHTYNTDDEIKGLLSTLEKMLTYKNTDT